MPKKFKGRGRGRGSPRDEVLMTPGKTASDKERELEYPQLSEPLLQQPSVRDAQIPPVRGRGRGKCRIGAELSVQAVNQLEDIKGISAPILKHTYKSRSDVDKTAEKYDNSSLSDLTLPTGGQLQPRGIIAAPQISIEAAPKHVMLKMVRRPNYGTNGKYIKLIANYFLLHCKEINVYHYDIDIVPRDRGRNMGKIKSSKDTGKAASVSGSEEKYKIGREKCKKIIYELVKNEKKFQKFKPVYDGQKNLYTHLPLPIKGNTKFEVIYQENDKNKIFDVMIKPVVKEDTLDNIIRLKPICEQTRDYSDEVKMVLETILRHRDPDSPQLSIGRSFFLKNNDGYDPLGEGCEIWLGYNQSIHFTEKGPAVVVNLSATAFHKSGSVLEYASDVLNRNITRNPILESYEYKKLSKALSAVRVQVTHLRYPRTFPVKGLTEFSARDLKILIDINGQTNETTVQRYFLNKYQIELQYPTLPCLHMRTSNNKTYIPFELCIIPPGQRIQGKLDGMLTSKMIRRTAIPPIQRFEEISESARTVCQMSAPYMDLYSLQMSLDPVHLIGRIQQPPSIGYSSVDSKSAITVPNDRGVWDMKMRKFLNPVAVNKWMLISFGNPKFCNLHVLQAFGRLLCETGQKVGLNISDPLEIKIYGIRDQTENVLNYVKKKQVDIAVIVLSPRDNYHSYEEVKFIGDTILQLITQCVDETVVVRKQNDQVATNICLKINSKLGGVNHILSKKPDIFNTPVIIFGADAVHSPKKPSIAAVVGSLDSYPYKYAVSCRVQVNEKKDKWSQEIILEMKAMVKNILKAFYVNTRKKPEKIVFYRDGVSEGQFQQVLNVEVPMIKEACKELEQSYCPPLTFIIVQKRHQTRFRPENPRDGVGKNNNVPPGTTVDTTVVHPVNFDYYLCSHEGIQGTSKPAHYTVLWDENKFEADEIQKLSYYLCHMYARCNRSISIPAPVKYADLAAYRAMKYVDWCLDKCSTSSISSDGSETLPQHITDIISNMELQVNKMFFV